MAATGSGSTLMLRLKEGMQRMKAAEALGLSQPFATGPIAQPFQGGNIASAQPPQPASTDIAPRERMLADADGFLKGIAHVSMGVTPDPSNQRRL